jgi:uncharacterized membrane protein
VHARIAASPRHPWRLVAVVFGTAGVAHFIMPEFFTAIVPPWLPAPRALVSWSGVAEVAGALGVLHPRTRVLAGWGLLALLVAVFPANVFMLQQAIASGAAFPWLLALAVRLPVQPVLMWWVWRATVRPVSRAR